MYQYKFLLATAGLLLTGLPGTSMLAQAASDEAEHDAGKIEEIIVTGSRIKRRDYFTPSPLMTISEEDIKYSGQWTLEETLNQMPQVTPDFGRASNNPGNGMAHVALRNMGPGRTLVLLNGRRVGPSGNRGAVDINNIPQALVERVEIITGGTSAVYGADALAGVVNFITRSDFSGFGIEASASTTEARDAESYDLNVTYGHNFKNGRGNISLYGGLYRREASYASDREHTRIAWLEDWQGGLEPGGSGAVPSLQIFWPPMYWPDDPDVEPPTTTFDDDGDPREFILPDDLYNYAPENYLQVPLDRHTLGLFANYQFADRVEGFVEASYASNEPGAQWAPVAAFRWVDVNLDNPVLTPAAAQLFSDQFECEENLACIFTGKRFLELGPRVVDIESKYYRITAGFRGDLGNDWEFDTWATFTRSSLDHLLGNGASYSRLLQGLLVDPLTGECLDPGGGCVPLDIFGASRLSDEGVRFIRYPDLRNPIDRTHQAIGMVVSGSPISTWAGPVDTALGMEWRSDESTFRTDEALFTGDVMGFGAGSPGGGSDSVSEIYAEAVVPLAGNRNWADYLGLELGARYSDYEYAGGVWSYKAGMEWQPLDSMRLRTMYQRSVRAPNSFELFEEQRSIIDQAPIENDPCTASEDPVGRGGELLIEKCVIQGLPREQVGVWEGVDLYPFEIIEGGNPHLEPEEGDTWMIGAVLTPGWLPLSSFAIDYYDFQLERSIGGISSWDICFDEQNMQHAFCDRVTRDPSGHVAEIVDTTVNKGFIETSGIDFQANFDFDLGSAWAIGPHTASFGINLIWTHLLSFKDQDSPVSTPYECAGFFGGPCQTFELGAWGGSETTFAENRIRASMSYVAGPLDMYLGWRWIEGSTNGNWEYWCCEPGEDLAVKSVGGKQYFDFGAGYSFSNHLTAHLGVNNLFDSDPPNMASNVWDNNTDTGLYDVFGRSYYLSVAMQY